MDFRRANTEPSMYFRRANTETYSKCNINLSKIVGKDEVFLGLAGLVLRFPLSSALGKSLGAALAALGKHPPSLQFYLE